MYLTAQKTNSFQKEQNNVLLCPLEEISALQPFLSKEELLYIEKKSKETKLRFFPLNKFSSFMCVNLFEKKDNASKTLELFRTQADETLAFFNKQKINNLTIVPIASIAKQEMLAYTEGMLLGNYQFLKYKTDAVEKENSVKELFVCSEQITSDDLNELNLLAEITCKCRDLVNEPVCYLNAVRLAEAFEEMGNACGVKTEILTQSKIEALKMGGLLAVNKGSIDPATFTIMEWKPAQAYNKQPIILVGKGIVYDTGGLNLKPDDYMNDMKSDMAGAATMAATICAVAKAKLPLHLIALMPATDNRPGGNAYAADDIIRMFDGTMVEVGNTDAEGRIILADALSYAKKYNPELVIDAATLTGAAHRAIGKYGIVAMHAKASKAMASLKQVGDETYERIAEFPFWDEYGDLIKSEIADIKNTGGATAGMITAGKFLEHFTDYPYIHLDIAGVAFMDDRYNYRPKGGTGTGVRLLYHFLKKMTDLKTTFINSENI